ncbi:MAG TPA: aldo/keto reductase [Steroidobacteraceae bacterium]|jgi:aryl-alcohol dehydrogenase-like predicted oxidoreductase|nr:aldo/keto reductase [Steroidobacteraceae bacterium]
MEQREIGRSGLKVSAIGLGCNNFGWMIGADASYPVIARALDVGITFFDTADIYGESEVVLGKALGSRRKDLVIATKFGMAASGLPGGASRSYVLQAAERSLKRLGTDYIDLFYLHRPDEATPLGETLEALDELIRQGKVRHAAASNMTAALLSESHAVASSRQLRGFIATQEHLSLLTRGAEASLIPTVKELHLGLIPYFPLASGLLTGKYQRGVAPPQGTRFDAWKQRSSSLLTEQNFDKVERLEAFAGEHQRSIGELAIAWLLAKPFVPSVTAGATKAAQVDMNVKAATWKLTAREVAAVERLAPV